MSLMSIALIALIVIEVSIPLTLWIVSGDKK